MVGRLTKRVFFKKEPPAFRTIFMLEIWERFGFYTVQGILVLFFVRQLGYPAKEAYFVFGAFSALLYGMVPLGGYLGDHLLGTKRTLLLGLLILEIGYVSLIFSSKYTVFYSLSLICVGSGLFKANPSSLLSRCYKKEDKRLHGAFTLYYMAINLGSIGALLLGPFLAAHHGYQMAWALSAIGLGIGIFVYLQGQKVIHEIDSPLDAKACSKFLFFSVFLLILVLTGLCAFFLKNPFLAKFLVGFITIITVGIYLWFMVQEEKPQRRRMGIALLLIGEGVLFFVLYQQMPTSLNLFAVSHVTPSLLGIPIDPQSFQALNPIWIVTISPILARFYSCLEARGFHISIPYKFAAGMFCSGVAFSLLFFARYGAGMDGIVSENWLIATYFFQSIGELLVSALGVAMVAELVPSHLIGFSMGFWFLASSVSGFLGASLAALTVLPTMDTPLMSLDGYTAIFGKIGLVTLVCSLLLWIIAPWMNRLIH